MNNLILRLDKLADTFEVYQEDDNEETRSIMIVVTRRNSYPINEQQKIVLDLFERKGIPVRVRVGAADLTLEQFELYGAYAPGSTKVAKTVTNPQGLYNLRSQLNKLELQAREMGEDSPQYAVTVRKISHLHAMLSTIEPDKRGDQNALRESDKRLRELEALLKNEVINE